MLEQHNYPEAERLREERWVEIPLTDDSLEALTIMLNLAHGHLGKGPSAVTPTTLGDIDALVDKYEWRCELLKERAQTWFQSYHIPIPSRVDRSFNTLICIASVFGFDRKLKQLELSAAKGFEIPIAENYVPEYPIPAHILSKFSSLRSSISLQSS